MTLALTLTLTLNLTLSLTLSLVLALTLNLTLAKRSHYPVHSPKELFYRSTDHHGWHMKQMVPFFEKMQLVKCHLLKTSGDEDVRLIYDSRRHREQSECLSSNPAQKHKWQPTQDFDKRCKEVE